MKTQRQKQIDSAARYASRAARSTKAQLALLDKRPGNAKRERARLATAKGATS